MYRVIYYNSINMITEKVFETLAEAGAFANTLDWCKVVSFTQSRTITDVTIP